MSESKVRCSSGQADNWNWCKNPAKEDGLCGVHLNTRKRNQERKAQEEAERQSRELRTQVARELRDLGVVCVAQWRSDSILITTEEAKKLRDRLAAYQEGR